ncbi:MAG TPA: hypothetical protein VFF27_12035 [Bacteroidia bacterium]|jgi:hypothetical protein|nr:hypothetical protein [Bacteroidia bacterium]
MSTEQIQEVVGWLNSQISHVNTAINEAHAAKNVGRETQYEGMRDAFIRCLNKLKNA